MKRIKSLALLFFCASFSLNIHAQFSGSGSGTGSDPYLITNEDELFDVRNDLSAHYKLMADIDLTEWIAEESPKDGWNPLGNATTPFTGIFDGNYHSIKGLYIERPTTDRVGLFGEIHQATVKNTALVNPIMTGGNWVGGIIGKILLVNDDHDDYNRNPCSNHVYDNVVIGGVIKGKSNIGGIIGGSDWDQKTYCHGTCYIKGNYSSTTIEGIKNCGGIIGYVNTRNIYYAPRGRYYQAITYLSDNNYIGNLHADEDCVGGIVGMVGVVKSYSSDNHNYNMSGGNLIGKKYVNGIIGYNAEGNCLSISNNVCYADTIASGESVPYRISSLSYENNYGSIATVLVYNGAVLETEDNNYNGVSYGARTLRRKTTYQGLGFDFNNQWAISELKSYPFNIHQSIPPELTSFTLSNSTVVSGTAIGNGKVYVFVDDKMFEGVVNDGQWQMSLGYLDASKRVTVSVQTNAQMPSPVLVVQKGDSAELPTGEIQGVSITHNISTFCSERDLDFSQTKGLIAYIAAGFNKGTVMLMRAQYVPAGEGIILFGEPGSYNVYTTHTKVHYANLLKGVLKPTTISPKDGEYTNFILTSGTTGVGFYAVSNEGEIGAHKAYLQLPTELFEQYGNTIKFDFEDEATGIHYAEQMEEDGHYYTIDGKRLNQRPSNKGVYIHKGKKIVITK